MYPAKRWPSSGNRLAPLSRQVGMRKRIRGASRLRNIPLACEHHYCESGKIGAIQREGERQCVPTWRHILTLCKI